MALLVLRQEARGNALGVVPYSGPQQSGARKHSGPAMRGDAQSVGGHTKARRVTEIL